MLAARPDERNLQERDLWGNYWLMVLSLLHLTITGAATVSYVGISVPFFSGLMLLLWCFFRDSTVFFAYPALLLMSLLFISPLILSGAPIALKVPPNGSEYDHGMIIGIYWFVGIFSFYLPKAQKVPNFSSSASLWPKWDFVPVVAALILVFFGLSMLRTGTLFDGGYRDVTEVRAGYIEYASLVTLIGFLCVKSSAARAILTAGVVVYLASTILVGLRLRFISVAIVYFCCVFGFRINQWWKAGSIGAGLVLFVLGAVRNAGFENANLGDALSIDSMYNQGALVSTAGGNFQSSKFYAYYVEHHAEPSMFGGLRFFLADVGGIFVTRRGLPEGLEVKSQTSLNFDIPGGGLLPGYFFAYGGVVGVIVASAMFMALFIHVLRHPSPTSYPYKILLAAYAPRVLMYDWIVAFKMMFAYFLLHFLYLKFRGKGEVASLDRQIAEFR